MNFIEKGDLAHIPTRFIFDVYPASEAKILFREGKFSPLHIGTWSEIFVTQLSGDFSVAIFSHVVATGDVVTVNPDL